MGFTTIDFIILVAYLAAVLFAGLHFSKKDMQGKEFFKERSASCTSPVWEEFSVLQTIPASTFCSPIKIFYKNTAHCGKESHLMASFPLSNGKK